MEEKFVYVIGDIHGCLPQLETMLQKIQKDRATYSSEPATIVFLGDYVDRGDSSKEVLDLLMDLNPKYHKFILGNHEDAMIKNCTVKDYGDGWENWGGKQTLKSFGLEVDKNKPYAVDKKYIDWLKSLPISIDTKTHYFCHAGINPFKPLDKQLRNVQLWIREAFLTAWPKDFVTKKHIVHGHSILDQVDVYGPQTHRTNLDAGCFETGLLLCGVFSNVSPSGPIRYLKVEGEVQSAYKGKPKGSWDVW